jgi:biopolymer transport protein ExbD
MAMGPASGGGDRFEPIANINITPLVDVSLVLVIIFMLTMPFLMEKSMKISDQGPAAAVAAAPKPPVVVEIDRSGVRIDGQSTAPREVGATLKRLAQKNGPAPVEIAADREVVHGQVVAVMDQIASAGISDLSLRQPQEETRGR